MGTVITKADFVQQSIIPASPNQIQQATGGLGEIQNARSWMTEAHGLVSSVHAILQDVMKMRQTMLPQEKTETPPTTVYRDNPNQHVKQVEVPKMVEVEHIARLLGEIIIIDAQRLPQGIKDMKVGDLIGENFRSFTYMGLDANTLVGLGAQQIQRKLRAIQSDSEDQQSKTEEKQAVQEEPEPQEQHDTK